MIRINQIKIKTDPQRALTEEELKKSLIKKAAQKLKVKDSDITGLSIAKHSMDCRKKPELFDVYVVDVSLRGRDEKKLVLRARDNNITLHEKTAFDFWKGCDKSKALPDKKIVIIGSGPAGLFCGYELAMVGFKPVILERGADIDKRTRIVEAFWKGEKLDLSTNVQFGEGGAGTFSDGKLNTVVKDKEGRGERVLDIFIKSGAPECIRYESKPHIGTDLLQKVVKNIRNRFIDAGGQIFFETTATGLKITDEGRITAVLAGERQFQCDMAVLAIGHSARDTFAMLKSMKVAMEPKPFAVGFRVEHPQKLINLSHYGIADAPGLPASPYKLTTTVSSGRGVYSFCMCPGGYVVNASSEEGHLAVNGMSYNSRDGLNANSAIIITVDPSDFGSDDILAGVEFQRKLEKKAFELGQGRIPTEYYKDFKKAVSEADESEVVSEGFSDEDFAPQMKGEHEFAHVHEILPHELNRDFVEGMENFGHFIKGYNDSRALISGVESRTSSPVRIKRGDDCQSVNVQGLYPCGEGAGYAGGIMSAAMDGIRIAQMIAREACSGD